MGPVPGVLVVEDERRLRELLTEVIPEMGFPVRAVRTGEEALELLGRDEAASVGILVLDVHLPGMSGLELMSRLRADGSDVEVIVLTAYADLATARAAIREGVADFLPKPSPLGEIEAALNRARLKYHVTRSGRAVGDAAPPAIEKVASTTSPVERETIPSLAEIERREITASLARHGGNRTVAAKELGISRRTLHYKLAEYRREGLRDFRP